MSNRNGKILAYKRVTAYEKNLAPQDYLEDGVDKMSCVFGPGRDE